VIFTERTKEHPNITWADITWREVEGNVRRLQERIYRATTNKAWRTVKSLQKLLVRATSNKLLAIRRITQENQGKHTAGIDGVVYDTPEARWKLFQEGLAFKGTSPDRSEGYISPKTTAGKDPWAYRCFLHNAPSTKKC
jgi:RNA-directed DNA polymerase